MGAEKFHMQESVNTLADKLVSMGLQDVVISPGSRNAPLILAFSRIQGLQVHSVIDERSAAYTALGISMYTGVPTAIVCTSGTAAVNYSPAITEGFYSRIPLLVITADRPGALVDQWTGQCIRQKGLFSNHIRAEFETPEDYSRREQFARIAEDAYKASIRPFPGPVHINVPLKEPLYASTPEQSVTTRPDVQTWEPAGIQRDDERIEELKRELSAKPLKVIGVIGAPESFDAWYSQPAFLPETNTHPVFPDLIAGPPVPNDLIGWDAFLHVSSNSDLADLMPDLLLSYGTHCLSKGLRQFLQRYKPVKHYHFGFVDQVGDPFGTKPEFIRSDYTGYKELLAALPADNVYREQWTSAIAAFRSSFSALPWSDFNEFSATRYLLEHIGPEHKLHFANSMPVRYASFLTANNGHRAFCNRGTSGIDGCTSTALGYAVRSGEPVTLITGDLAFFYDINAFWRESVPSNFKVIVLNNNGGGIFNLIDGPSSQPSIMNLQQTPVTLDMEFLSKAYGLTYFRASDLPQLEKGLDEWSKSPGPALLEIQTNKDSNKSFYSKFIGIK